MKKTLYVLACTLFVLTLSSCALFSDSTSTNTNTVAQVNRPATTNANQARKVQPTQTSRSNSNQAAQQTSQTHQSTDFDIFPSNHGAAQRPVQNTTTRDDANTPKLPPNAKIICFDESRTSLPEGNKLDINNDNITIIVNDKTFENNKFLISVKAKTDKKYYTFTHHFLGKHEELRCEEYEGEDDDCWEECFEHSYNISKLTYDEKSGILTYVILESISQIADCPLPDKTYLNPEAAYLYIIDTYAHAIIVGTIGMDGLMSEPTTYKLEVDSGDWLYTWNAQLYTCDDENNCTLKPPVRISMEESGFYYDYPEVEKAIFTSYQECLNKN